MYNKFNMPVPSELSNGKLNMYFAWLQCYFKFYPELALTEIVYFYKLCHCMQFKDCTLNYISVAST
jgi:hypothetical protein